MPDSFHLHKLEYASLHVLHRLLESAYPHVHWVGDVIQLSHLLLPPSPPGLNHSQHQGLFQWVSSLHQMAKILELQLQRQSFCEYSRLVSFRIDWLDLLGLAVQGSLKNLLQHHNLKASVLQCSAFLWSNSHIHTPIRVAKIQKSDNTKCWRGCGTKETLIYC